MVYPVPPFRNIWKSYLKWCNNTCSNQYQYYECVPIYLIDILWIDNVRFTIGAIDHPLYLLQLFFFLSFTILFRIVMVFVADGTLRHWFFILIVFNNTYLYILFIGFIFLFRMVFYFLWRLHVLNFFNLTQFIFLFNL